MSEPKTPTIEELEQIIKELKMAYEEQAKELAYARLSCLKEWHRWDGLLVFHSLDGLEYREPIKDAPFYISHRRWISRPIIERISCARILETGDVKRMHPSQWKREYELRNVEQVSNKFLLHYHERRQS